MNKKDIRKSILQKRDTLKTRGEKDFLIFDRLISSNIYKKSKVLFTYVSFGSEVDTLALIEKAISDGKTVCIPKTNFEDKEMKAIKIESLRELIKTKQGILEPIGGEELNIDSIDFIIMPGVAFDFNGNRIGYGAGFYDRFLNKQRKKSIKVALCYETQIIEDAMAEEHDIKVDYIITENYIKNIGK